MQVVAEMQMVSKHNMNDLSNRQESGGMHVKALHIRLIFNPDSFQIFQTDEEFDKYILNEKSYMNKADIVFGEFYNGALILRKDQYTDPVHLAHDVDHVLFESACNRLMALTGTNTLTVFTEYKQELMEKKFLGIYRCVDGLQM